MERGFTILEILITITVISIIGTAAGISLITYYRTASVEAAVKDVDDIRDELLPRKGLIRIEKKAQQIKEILTVESERKKLNTAGIVTKVNRIVTKTGKPMLFAKIADFNDTMEVVVFPDTLAQNSQIWEEDSVLLVSGRMSRRNGEPKLICDSATTL